MTKGNKSKRIGTANERYILRRLQKFDPPGRWQSRTTLPDGCRRPTPPTHGFDVWSDERQVLLECKERADMFTFKEMREWLEQAENGFDAAGDSVSSYDYRVVFRKKGSSECWSAWEHGLNNRDLIMMIMEEDIQAFIDGLY